MISGSSIFTQYIAWYDFGFLCDQKYIVWYAPNILFHKKRYPWVPDCVPDFVPDFVHDVVGVLDVNTIQRWLHEQNDWHSEIRLEILCQR